MVHECPAQSVPKGLSCSTFAKPPLTKQEPELLPGLLLEWKPPSCPSPPTRILWVQDIFAIATQHMAVPGTVSSKTSHMLAVWKLFAKSATDSSQVCNQLGIIIKKWSKFITGYVFISVDWISSDQSSIFLTDEEAGMLSTWVSQPGKSQN